MKRFPKSREINLKSLKKLKNERSRIFKKKKTISFSSNERDTSLEYENQERILLIIKKYSTSKNQIKLIKIL